MSREISLEYQNGFEDEIRGDYKRVGLMVVTAFLLSAATIVYYNHKLYYEQIASVYTSVEIAAITFMPYMISAVVATLTTLGVMAMLPMIRSKQVAGKICARLSRIADGDLTTNSRLDCGNEYLGDVASELNYSIGFLSSSIAQWKIINRQQWDLLECIRRETFDSHNPALIRLVEKMEDNWAMIAEIEEKFRT